MSCVAVTTAFLLLAALCIQDTTAYSENACGYFRLNVDNKGWHNVAGTFKKIKIVTTPLTQPDAKTVCTDMMGDLISAYSKEVHKDAMCWLQNYHDGMRVWVGGIRDGSYFKWISQGGPIQSNWMGGQPDNLGAKCLEMNWGGMGLYNDDYCDRKKPFICEYYRI